MSIVDVVAQLERARRTERTRWSRHWLSLSVAVVDLLVVALATVLAVRFRTTLPFFDAAGDVADNALPAAGFIVVIWLATLFSFGAYKHHLFGAGTDEYRTVVNASFVTAALSGMGAFLLKFPLSRGFFVLLFGVGIPLLLLSRFLLRRVLQRLRRYGALGQRVLLVGTPGHVSEIASVLSRESWLGYHVIGCTVPAPYADLHETSSGIPVLGTTDQVAETARAQGIDVLFFTPGAFDSVADMRAVAWELESDEHVQIVLAPGITDVSAERVRVRPVAGLPLVHLERPQSLAAAHWAKRLFDVLGSAALILLTAPLMLFVAIWIKIDDRGPVIFRQTRVGRDGETFECLKLRSMVVDAEQQLAALGDREGHVLFKMENDPRITRPGHFIRRFSLDELPQLWNVLRGEMSLVGPRPPLPGEVERYESSTRRRLNVRPGVTGLWQVSGRSDLSWEDTVRLDLYYVDNWSMVQDLSILARTLRAVLGSRGAY